MGREFAGQAPGGGQYHGHAGKLRLFPISMISPHDISMAMPLSGQTVSSGAARAFTDFRIHRDGFSRILIQDLTLTPRQSGRLVQRLVEIDSYRMMALLALPFAHELAPLLAILGGELVEITSAMVQSGDKDEPVLLARLTKLEAEIESRRAASAYRFSAAAAYYDIVQRRTGELREERIQGLQLFQEFTERRLEPAMSTCAAATARQEVVVDPGFAGDEYAFDEG